MTSASDGSSCKNTEHLLAGYPANNVLLCGDRGTGKSSSIKALLHRYSSRGLRLVEVAKDDLGEFQYIAERLRARPQSFVISWTTFPSNPMRLTTKALKAVLEGSVAAQPRNVVIYATSNRSHLIRENFSRSRRYLGTGKSTPRRRYKRPFHLATGSASEFPLFRLRKRSILQSLRPLPRSEPVD